MTVQLVLFWDWTDATPATGLTAAGRDVILQALATLPGLVEAQIFTPSKAEDLYTDDGRSPPLGLQLHFDTIAALEAAAGPDGGLQVLAKAGALDGLDPAHAEAQAFLKRDYAVDEPRFAPDATPCSFVVHYPGPAQDLNAWLDYYIAGHPGLMRRMPGIRAIEILTPVDWVNRLPIASVRHMQRNRVTFDSPAALTAAIQSPIRHELREDFNGMPPFEGGNYHHAMLVETFHPPGR